MNAKSIKTFFAERSVGGVSIQATYEHEDDQPPVAKIRVGNEVFTFDSPEEAVRFGRAFLERSQNEDPGN